MKWQHLNEYAIRYRWIFQLPILMIVAFVLGQIFFDAFIFSIVLSGSCLFFIKYLKKNSQSAVKKKVEEEFKAFIYSIASSMSIGKSFENSVKESYSELKKELEVFLLEAEILKIVMAFETNMNINTAFEQLAKIYDIESIHQFSKVIQITVRQGGSVQAVVEKTVRMIDEKNNVEKELEVIITQKKFELYMLLSFVPLMVLYLRSVSDNFAPLMYGTLQGRCIMFVGVLLYVMSALIGRRIVNITI